MAWQLKAPLKSFVEGVNKMKTKWMLVFLIDVQCLFTISYPCPSGHDECGGGYEGVGNDYF